MMKASYTKSYESYPYWIMTVSNLLSITIYSISAFIIYKIGIFWATLYLVYIILLEIRILKLSCVNCYYYGKKCAFGKGILCSLFFKKGYPKKFSKTQITWKELIPDIMVSLIPIIVGIILLIMEFNLLILMLLIFLFFFTFVGNGLVRGLLACKYCKQRKIGCPTEQLFSKKK